MNSDGAHANLVAGIILWSASTSYLMCVILFAGSYSKLYTISM